MTTPPDIRAGPPPWSLAGFRLGLRLALPVAPAMIAFGLAVGATGARKGLTFVDNALNVPAQAGTHIPEAGVCGTMGPRWRGDDARMRPDRSDHSRA